jgi:hypothetical protein
MKRILILYSLFSFIHCSSNAQKNSGILIIDKYLSHHLFEELIIQAGSGYDKMYIDSVLVYSDSSDNGNILINADISRNDFPYFDTCKSFYSRDTLMIEFTNISKMFYDEKILIKLYKDKYLAFFIGEKEYTVVPEYLKFKNPINKKGQEIFGELSFKLEDKDGNLKYALKGPFRCIVK